VSDIVFKSIDVANLILLKVLWKYKKIYEAKMK